VADPAAPNAGAFGVEWINSSSTPRAVARNFLMVQCKPDAGDNMATIKRKARAQWAGSGKDGKGALTTASGTLSNTPYSFTTRFENGTGTNPEELIAAAHAGCFTMALAFRLSAAGHPPTSLETGAEVSLTQEGSGWKIAASALSLKGSVPDLTAEEFTVHAKEAEKTCPVSRVLNAEITLSIEFV
jgi:lipoyl-dependent peroxiredoxin